MENLAGGGAGAADVNGGEGDVPDVRFLLPPPKINFGNRPKNWINNNPNSPLKREITLDEKEQIFINFLKSMNYGKEELTVRFRAPDRLNRQPPMINALNGHACFIMGAMGRKRRLCLFLMIILFGFARAMKIAKSSKVQVPQQFSNPDQLRGDIKACQEGLKTLTTQLCAVIDQIEGAGYEAVRIPDVFSKPLELPKPLGTPKGK